MRSPDCAMQPMNPLQAWGCSGLARYVAEGPAFLVGPIGEGPVVPASLMRDGEEDRAKDGRR